MTTNTMPTPISSHAAFAAGGPQDQAVLSLPAHLVAELPAPMTLRLRVPGAPVPVCIWTGATELGAAPVLADTIVFHASELEALVVAAEADRIWHREFLGLCFEKWRRPDQRVTTAELLAGANPDTEVSWSLERVLQRLGVELDAVELEAAPIVRPLHAAA